MIKVPSGLTCAFWGFAAPLLEPAVKRGDERDLNDYFNACVNGTCQLWVKGNSAMISEVLQYSLSKKAICAVAGGDIADFKETWAAFLEWAKLQGCDEVRIIGRKGWIRALCLDECQTIGGMKI